MLFFTPYIPFNVCILCETLRSSGKYMRTTSTHASLAASRRRRRRRGRARAFDYGEPYECHAYVHIIRVQRRVM